MEAEPPDLVVLDLMMPRMDGHQVLKQDADEPAAARHPGGLSVGQRREPNVVIGVGLAAADYITKPFRPA
jgi:putative two-component system response regulator